jgi:hypothetical protein
MRIWITSILSTTIILGLFVTSAAVDLSQEAAAPAASASSGTAELTARIQSAAGAFLATLGEADRTNVRFPFEDSQKTRWSNLPTGLFRRTGLRLGDLTPAQRAAAMTILSTALSREGYEKIRNIMRGDEVLRGAGTIGGRGGGRFRFGEDEYYIAFVGAPSATTPWMLQFGGHHLAINLTIVGSRSTMTPSLPAAQPATYTLSGQTIRPLGHEQDKSFALINALNVEQRGRAVLNYRVTDLVLGPGKDGRVIQPEGIPASALSPAQQDMLLDLVREWAGIVGEPAAAARMSEIRANLAHTYFAWSGPTANGSAAYFRIQGPTVVIEYAPQGGIDHVHTIYRDPTNDYGAKLINR